MRASSGTITALERVPKDHRAPAGRFFAAIDDAAARGLLREGEAAIVREHVVRLGERGRRPANTGNLEDLFVHTLETTKDPIRAFAQVLADSVKIVPLPSDARLEPALRDVRTGRVYRTVGELPFDDAQRMLVAHTAVAYTDAEGRAAAEAMIRCVGKKDVERELAGMILQSQHLPSSSYVLAAASGLALEVEGIALRSGCSAHEARDIQKFFDIAAEFRPAWREIFAGGATPAAEYLEWRDRMRAAREKLPETLIHQLEVDTLTNFGPGTMASGKWTEIIAKDHPGAKSDELPEYLARIVRAYQTEWTELHGRSLEELEVMIAPELARFGITFDPRTKRAVKAS